MIKQLLNLVIAKYCDLSVSRRSIICLSLRLWQINDLLATAKSQYFAQPRPIINIYITWLEYQFQVIQTSALMGQRNYFFLKFSTLLSLVPYEQTWFVLQLGPMIFTCKLLCSFVPTLPIKFNVEVSLHSRWTRTKTNAVQLHFHRAHLDPRETEGSKEVVDQW